MFVLGRYGKEYLSPRNQVICDIINEDDISIDRMLNFVSQKTYKEPNVAEITNRPKNRRKVTAKKVTSNKEGANALLPSDLDNLNANTYTETTATNYEQFRNGLALKKKTWWILHEADVDCVLMPEYKVKTGELLVCFNYCQNFN